MALHALLLRLRVDDRRSGPPAAHQAHGFFLRFIEGVDPDLSHRLHDESGRKPYTVACLDQAPAAQDLRRRIDGGETLLRLTLLDDHLFGTFVDRLKSVAERSGPSLRLNASTVQVAGVVHASEHTSLVGSTTFEELVADAGLDPNLDLTFVSPTAFSLGTTIDGKRRMSVLPEPGLVFDSLLRKWNELAPPHVLLDPDWTRVLHEEVIIASHDVRTERVQFPRYAQVGFTGRCRFCVPCRDAELLRLTNMLADFAMFAGVGYKTTMGMGQAWRLFAPVPSRPVPTIRQTSGV